MEIIKGVARPGECIYKYNDSFVFYTVESNGIYVWNSTTGKCEKIGCADEDENSWLYVTCMEINNILYFIPCKAKHMLGYHLETGETERILIWDRDGNPMYHKVAYYGGRMYLFPEVGNEIFIFNIKTGQGEFFKVRIAAEWGNSCFFKDIFCENNTIWSVTGQDTNIYSYDLEENRCQKFTLKHNDRIISLTGAGKELFLLTVYGKVIEWNIESGSERLIFSSICQIEEPYFAIKYSFNKLWMIPRYDACIRAIDLKTKERNTWDLSYLPEIERGMFECVVQQDDFLFMTSYENSKLVVADTKKCKIEIHNIYMEFMLLLEIVSNNLNFEKQKSYKCIGTYIWETIKKQ